MLYSGKWIIVQVYERAEKAQEEHVRWISRMTGVKLPEGLRDNSVSGISLLCKMFGADTMFSYKD